MCVCVSVLSGSGYCFLGEWERGGVFGYLVRASVCTNPCRPASMLRCPPVRARARARVYACVRNSSQPITVSLQQYIAPLTGFFSVMLHSNDTLGRRERVRSQLRRGSLYSQSILFVFWVGAHVRSRGVHILLFLRKSVERGGGRVGGGGY